MLERQKNPEGVYNEKKKKRLSPKNARLLHFTRRGQEHIMAAPKRPVPNFPTTIVLKRRAETAEVKKNSSYVWGGFKEHRNGINTG